LFELFGKFRDADDKDQLKQLAEKFDLISFLGNKPKAIKLMAEAPDASSVSEQLTEKAANLEYSIRY
jgi:hypothetical protein